VTTLARTVRDMALPSVRATESDNAPAWDGRPGRYEVWYLTFNDLPTRTGFWIRYTLAAPTAGPPHARLWFAGFDAASPARGFALNQGFPREALRLSAAPFEVGIGAAWLRHDGAQGELEGHGHHARWDLRWPPSSWTHRHLPDLVYRTSFADTRVLSPNPRIDLHGTVEMDGRRFELDGAPGGQTHLWGRRHADSWAWGRCSAFQQGGPALLEAVTVRVRRAGVLMPALTLLTLYLDGEELRFTRLRDLRRTRGHFGGGRYAFAAEGSDARLEGEFSCPAAQRVLAEYRDPDGAPRYCANTETGDLVLTVRRRAAGAAWDERRLVAHGTAHFEVGGRQPDGTVEQLHLSI
jgi:hypothetical protein